MGGGTPIEKDVGPIQSFDSYLNNLGTSNTWTTHSSQVWDPSKGELVEGPTTYTRRRPYDYDSMTPEQRRKEQEGYTAEELYQMEVKDPYETQLSVNDKGATSRGYKWSDTAGKYIEDWQIIEDDTQVNKGMRKASDLFAKEQTTFTPAHLQQQADRGRGRPTTAIKTSDTIVNDTTKGKGSFGVQI